MNSKILFISIFFFIAIAGIFPQQRDSVFTLKTAGEQKYIPLSLLFSSNNFDHYAPDSSSNVNRLPAAEKPGFFKDYIYIVGTAVVAAIIYFLWPEDNPVVQKKLTFGTPPPPK